MAALGHDTSSLHHPTEVSVDELLLRGRTVVDVIGPTLRQVVARLRAIGRR